MTAVHINDLLSHWASIPRPVPWTVVGVIPTQQDYMKNGNAAFHSSRAFCYTVSGGPSEMWCPLSSIEDRYTGADLISAIVNVLFAALGVHLIKPGDDVIVPLGIPDDHGDWERDADAVFWVGEAQLDPDHRRFQTNMAPHVEWVIPIRWSSPLGWEDD